MQSKDLPIYRVTYELFREIVKLSRNFPRDIKMLVSGRMQAECTELVLNVYRANCARDPKARREYLAAVLEGVQVLELIIRLCRDMRFISIKHHSRVVSYTDQVGRQAYGWKNAT